MENWDPQAMLDFYIHNYLIKKNMHTTAEIFAREANFIPQTVAIDCPEGFLAEWWSIFWDRFNARCPYNDVATQANLNAGYVKQTNLSAMLPMPGMEVSVSDFTMMQGQATVSLIDERMSKQHCSGVPLPFGDLNSGSQLRYVDQLARTLPSSINSSHLPQRVYNGSQLSFARDDIFSADPSCHLPNSIQLQAEPSYTGIQMHEQEYLRLPVNNLTSNPQILNVDQLAHILPSASYFSHPQEKVYEMFPPSVARNNQFGTSPQGPNSEPANTDARMHRKRFLRLPVSNSNSNTHDLHVDQLAPMLPSSNNCSHPQKNKKRQRSVTGDDKCGSSLRRSVTVLPTQYAPMILQPRRDAKQLEQGCLTLPARDFNSNSQLVDIDQLARLLSSSGNYSQPQSNVDKKSQLPLTRDERCGANSGRSIAEPCRSAPTALQFKPNAGSSTSSNFANSNPSSRI